MNDNTRRGCLTLWLQLDPDWVCQAFGSRANLNISFTIWFHGNSLLQTSYRIGKSPVCTCILYKTIRSGRKDTELEVSGCEFWVFFPQFYHKLVVQNFHKYIYRSVIMVITRPKKLEHWENLVFWLGNYWRHFIHGVHPCKGLLLRDKTFISCTEGGNQAKTNSYVSWLYHIMTAAQLLEFLAQSKTAGYLPNAAF